MIEHNNVVMSTNNLRVEWFICLGLIVHLSREVRQELKEEPGIKNPHIGIGEVLVTGLTQAHIQLPLL